MDVKTQSSLNSPSIMSAAVSITDPVRVVDAPDLLIEEVRAQLYRGSFWHPRSPPTPPLALRTQLAHDFPRNVCSRRILILIPRSPPLHTFLPLPCWHPQYFGNVGSPGLPADMSACVCTVSAPCEEAFQAPDFDEYVIVLEGTRPGSRRPPACLRGLSARHRPHTARTTPACGPCTPVPTAHVRNVGIQPTHGLSPANPFRTLARLGRHH